MRYPVIRRVQVITEWRWGAFMYPHSRQPFAITRSLRTMIRKLRKRHDLEQAVRRQS